MSSEVLDSITIDNSSNGGSFTETYDAVVMEDTTMPDDANTVLVTQGFEVRRGYRKSLESRLLVPDAFAGTGSSDSIIDDVMEPRHDVEITLTWMSGTTSVLSGAKLLAQPIMDAVPDNTTVYMDPSPADDDPDNDSDSSWTELSEVVGTTEHDSENVTSATGRDQPYWKYSRFMHSIPLRYDSTAYGNIKTEENAQPGGNEVDIAIENQAGNFRIYRGVRVRVHQMPSPEADGEVNHMILHCTQAGSFTDIVEFPSGAEDYFYGVSLTAESFGHEEGDIWTENR